MRSCPDCHEQLGNLKKHQAICLVKNNKELKTWLESLEWWLNRMERHLNHCYRFITRYTYVGKHDADRRMARSDFESATDMVDRVPMLLERVKAYRCERVAGAQHRASIISKQVSEIRTILRSL